MFDSVKDTIQSHYKVTYDTIYSINRKEIKQPEPFSQEENQA